MFKLKSFKWKAERFLYASTRDFLNANSVMSETITLRPFDKLRTGKLRVNGLGFVAGYMEEIRKDRIWAHIVCVAAGSRSYGQDAGCKIQD